MVRVLVSDTVAQRLRVVVDAAASGAAEGSSGGQHALHHLADELHNPLEPPAYAGKGAKYPEGTVLSHERLFDVAEWASSLDIVKKEDEDDHAEDSRRSPGDRAEREVAKKLSTAGITLHSLSFEALLKGAEIATPILPKPVRSAELIETLCRIDLARQEAEYNAMLAGTEPGSAQGSKSFRQGQHNAAGKIGANAGGRRDRASEAEEWAEVRRQLGAIANVGISVAAVVTAVWWAGGTAGPIWKTAVALPSAILVAVAEVVLYSRHWTNIQKRKAAAPNQLPQRKQR